VSEQLTLADLESACGIPARTIRFYIARGLLPGPTKAGRDAAYTKDHLTKLNRIKKLQADGRTLTEIALILSGSSNTSATPPPTEWWQYAITDEVIVWVKAGASPWLTKQIRRAVNDFAAALRKAQEESGEEPENR
jgi:DNA-binding transcriptional MerR regulator